MSIGLVAGTREVMQVVKGRDNGKSVFMGGTFSANPLAMAMAKAVLQYLSDNRGDVYPYLNENGQKLRNRVNDYCNANRISVRMMGLGSMSRLMFTDKAVRSRRERDQYEIDNTLQDLFYLYLLLEKGIHVIGNRIIFLSTAHREEHVEKIGQAIVESVEFFATQLGAFR